MDNRIHAIEQDADIFARAVSCLLKEQHGDACEILSTLPKNDPIETPAVNVAEAFERLEPAKMEPLTTLIRARVYKRDGWRCRYCCRKLVVPGILELLTALCPGFNGLLPGHHMSYANTERAVERVYPNVDHVHAVANGGAWLDENNHVTACTPCNTKKSDRAGWVPRPIMPNEWDGLTSSYRALAESVDIREQYHSRWLHALEL